MNDRTVALVTGATGGIGLATAAALANAGYRVAASGPTEETLCAARSALPPDALTLSADLADLSAVEGLAASVLREWGRIDLLVNNAAWRELRTMRDVSADSWDRTLRICLTAPAFLARSVAEKMSANRRGVIVNVSSVMAERSFGLATAYVAAKAGLDAVTRELAVLYGGQGIRVVGIAPGAVDTAMSADYAVDETAASVRQFSEEMIPNGRWARPEEIASAIVSVASDQWAYLNGTTISLDGGWSAALYPRTIRESLYPGEQS